MTGSMMFNKGVLTMGVNLQEFWVVQLSYDNSNVKLYTNLAKAEAQARLHDLEVDKLIASATNEEQENYYARLSHALIWHYPQYSTNRELWLDNKGQNSVQWGYPALQRGINRNAN